MAQLYTSAPVVNRSAFQCALLVCFFSRLISFSQAPSAPDSAGNPNATYYRKAAETFATLDQSNNFAESLSYADMNILPMGLKQTISNTEITIAVSDVRWETSHTELTVFARIKIPQRENDKELMFGAQGIKLSHHGDIIGDATLVLMDSVTIPIQGNTAALTLAGNFDNALGRAKDELTYVSIDCKGFREMGMTGVVEFPESLLKPVDHTGKVIRGKRVKGIVKAVVKDWNDLLLGMHLPPFEIAGLHGFIFTVNDAVFDFSDLRNDPLIAFPRGYEMNYMIPGNSSLWRGVFVRDLVVTLPEQFSKKGSDKRVSFGAQNMLLDNNGISGVFAATGILPIDQGSASGWRFSVDKFSLTLEANELTGAEFSGAIGLPVSENSNLGYDAIITADNAYLLRVKPMDQLKFDVFHAEAELKPNSYIELKVVEGKFKPEALLHGSLNFAARLGSTAEEESGKKIAEFKGIEFRSLRLKTDAPRFTAEYFGYKGEMKMMNFPVSVTRIGLRANEDEVALGMDLKVTLSDDLFAGTTTLEVVGAMKAVSAGQGEEPMHQWKYEKLKISNIAVNAKIAETFTIKGGLTILSDDPVYGDGYAGNIQLSFDKVLKGLDVKARAMFGRKEFRYWFVDGLVSLPGQGIPAFPPVNLKGFGGGVANRMKRAGTTSASPLGASYIPDENTGIGVKAAVLFNVGSDAAVSGEASFEIAFNRSGGLNFIGFYGFAKFVGKIPGTENIEKFVGDKMKKVAEMEEKFVKGNPELAKTLERMKQYESNKAAETVFQPTQKPGEEGFSAAMGIQYDFTQKSLHATFDLYVKALGGVVRGTASGNRAGWAVLHIDPNEWYIHMGTPTDRLGLKMGIAGISVETGSYLMLGSRIPGSPPPPKEVADILGVEISALDYMRDLNALGDGKGFAFGASLKVATGDITFLILYANFQAGLGFDIMLKDYGDAQCKGRSGSIGFDGWYANGQAYAYLQGELGVKVNLRFIKGKFPIIKGAAAALIQAKLPNPMWFRGYLGVKFSVLGGLVSGRCRFKLTIGEECELVIPGGSPVDIRMISDLSPKDREKDVDVFAAPQATFAMRVGTPFSFEDDEGIRHYRISLNEFTVLDGTTPVEGKLIWASEKDGVSFYSNEVLPPNRTLKAVVKVGFEQWQNGRWAMVYTAGVKAQEIMEIAFTTGGAPENIPLQNIEYTYPVVDQRFFLKDESKKGYVQLKRGQQYLFSPDYKNEIHIVKSDGTKQAVPFTYSTASNRIDYTMPDLALQEGYSFNLVSLSGKSGGAESEITASSEDLGDDENTITVTRKQANSIVRSDIGKPLLDYEFYTSTHGTLAQKIQSISKGSPLTNRVASDVISLQYEISAGEPFDVTELSGTAFSGYKPTVKAEAILNDAYFKEDIYPYVYKNYPVGGALLDRDTTYLGFPPVRAIPLSTQYLTEIEGNNFYGMARSRFPFIYNLPQLYKEDFGDIQHKVVNRFLGTPQQSQYSGLIMAYYRFIRHGYYKVGFQYVMPDGTTGSRAVFEYYNFIK